MERAATLGLQEVPARIHVLVQDADYVEKVWIIAPDEEDVRTSEKPKIASPDIVRRPQYAPATACRLQCIVDLGDVLRGLLHAPLFGKVVSNGVQIALGSRRKAWPHYSPERLRAT